MGVLFQRYLVKIVSKGGKFLVTFAWRAQDIGEGLEYHSIWRAPDIAGVLQTQITQSVCKRLGPDG